MTPRPAPAAWVALCVACAVLLVAARAGAVPAFARKYRTSCQTCHVAFPKLTPFGEAFRRAGWRFPRGEEEATKEEPVPLGQAAHRDAFPDAVWPGQVPGAVPLAVQVAGTATYAPQRDPRTSFADLGGSVALTGAGAIDDVFSAWAGVRVASSAGRPAQAEIDRALVFVKPFDDPVLGLRIGRFEPGLSAVSMHRMLGLAPWLVTTPVRDDPFTLEPAQNGVEMTGVVGRGKVEYAAGVVEGGGDRVNAAKDVYSRLGLKVGGMRLDGAGQEADPRPWRETSLRIGGFGYAGQARIGDPAVASQDDRFRLVGADAGATWRDLSVTGAFAVGRNAHPTLADPLRRTDSVHVFGQIDWVAFPWLVPTARWERRRIGAATTDRASGGVYALLRANVRAQVLASVEGAAGMVMLDRIVTGLNVSF